MTDKRHFHLEESGATLVVELQSKVSSLDETALYGELSTLLARLASPTVRSVLFDFRLAPYFGSSMLEALLTVWQKAQAEGRTMAICGLSQVSREVLKVSKFDTIWPVHSSRAAALAALQE